MTNTALRQAADTVIASSETAHFMMFITFSSEDDANFTYEPIVVDYMIINQGFGTNYMDDITVSFHASPREYRLLNDHDQDFLATVRMVFLSRTGQTVDQRTPPIVKTYRAMLIDPQNMREVTVDAEKRIEYTMTIDMRLVETSIYRIRQQKIHGIFQNTTLKNILNYTTRVFDITKTAIVTPDNTHTYKHIIIPPAKGFLEIFTYLQEQYGVYMNSLRYYYTDGSLYIYPPYDTNPKFPEIARIYRVEKGDYAGSSSFHHRVDASLTDIVTTGETESLDLSQIGAENEGTTQHFLRASQLIDGFAKPASQDISYQPNTSLAVETRVRKNMMSSRKANRYTAAHDNIFNASSHLAQHQGRLTRVLWPQAVPFLLKPGHRIEYIHEFDGTIMHRSGILDNASFYIERSAQIAGGYLFTCYGSLTLRLSIEDTDQG